MTPRRLALAIAALTACRRPPPAAPPPPPPPSSGAAAVTADAGALPSAPPEDLCTRALAPHRAAVARASGDDAPWAEALASFGRCVPTPTGAWVVSLDAVERVDEQGQWVSVRGRWSVARVGRDGSGPRLTRDEEWSSHYLPAVQGAVAHDYDGDGEPELVLLRRASVHEGADQPRGEVLTIRGGAVVPYAPADGLAPDEARDVDGDGRPDLVTRAPYRGEGDDAPSDFTYLMEGPALLAHALPGGGFSRDDEVARRFAREACPARVPAVLPAASDDLSRAAVAVACARLWGVASAAVSRAVRARCASPEENGGGSPRRPHCGDTRVLLRWAAATPPLTLP